MAIYDYDQNQSQVFKSIGQFVGQSTSSTLGSHSKLRDLIDVGEFQQALELLKDRPSDAGLLNVKAVLLMRTGHPNTAANLLRSHVWDLQTFTLHSDVPAYIQLNFATALLMTGHIAGCLEIIRSINDAENQQANILLDSIKGWEKSLSLFSWLDWKICGIEHLKREVPIIGTPGRFGWEPKVVPVLDELSHVNHLDSAQHELAC